MRASVGLISLMTLLMVSGVAFAGTTLYDGASDTTPLAGTADFTVTPSGSVYNLLKTVSGGQTLTLGVANSAGQNGVNTQDWTATFVTGSANAYPGSTQGLVIQPRLAAPAGSPVPVYRLPRICVGQAGGTGPTYAFVSLTYLGPPDAAAYSGTRTDVSSSRANLAFRCQYILSTTRMICSLSTNGLAGPFNTLASINLWDVNYTDTTVTPNESVNYAPSWLDLNATVYLIMDPNGNGQAVVMDRFEMTGNDVANINTGAPPPAVPQATPSTSAPTLSMWGAIGLGICLLAIAFTALARKGQNRA